MVKAYGHGYKPRVLITGISGFIGSELAKKLADEGYAVAGYLRHSPRVAENIKSLQGQAMLFNADLRDASTISWTLRTFRPEYVIHLAAITPVGYSFEHPHEVTEVDFLGTIDLAEACRRELPELKKFIFASSMEIYGRQPAKPFTEKTTPNPTSPYAVAKYSAEQYLNYMYQVYKFPSVIVRPSNVYGRKNDKYFITETAITQMLTSQELNLGNPEPVRGYIYINDLVDIYQTLLEAPNKKVLGETFNTGPAQGLSVKGLVESIAQVMDWHGKINWGTREARSGEIPYLCTDGSKLTKATGWKPKYTHQAGLREIITHWSSKNV